MNILRNLLGYREESLEEVEIDGRRYMTDGGFSPLYILGQAFGASSDESSYNHRLAQSVLDAWEHFQQDIPAIVQSEIGVCLDGLGANGYFTRRVGQMYESGEATSLVASKIDTRGVLTESKQVLDVLGLPYDLGLFVAHPFHMARVLHTAHGVGLEGKPFVRKKAEWPRNDSQPWVRSPFSFVPREFFARFVTK